MEVNISKFRKNGHIISKSSSKALLNAIAQKYGERTNAQVGINGQLFYPKERNDGRIEIPARIRVGSGKRTVNIVQVKEGDITRQKRKFSTAFRTGDITTQFYFVPFEEVDRDRLADDIFFKMLKVRKASADVFYVRLHFLILSSNSFDRAFVRTLPEMEVGFESEKQLRAFIAEVFDEVFDISLQPYVEGIIFVKYSVTYSTDIRVRRRV